MKQLFKKTGKDFVILNLSDIQILSFNWKNKDLIYQNFLKTVDELVNKVKPDLITITGDLVYREDYLGYKFLSKYIDHFNIPWAPIFGNHDVETGYKVVNKQADILLECPNCLFEKGDRKLGCGNYVITICNEKNECIEALIFMDTHDRVLFKQGDEKTIEVYDTLNKVQLNWYKKQISLLEKVGCVDSSLFIHIPNYSYKLAVESAIKEEDLLQIYNYNIEENNKEPYCPFIKSNIWKNDAISSGIFNEPVCCYPEDDGVLDVVIECKHTKNIFAGHDHLNACRINYKGIWHNYVLKTGIGCYYANHINGGTIIKIDDFGVKSVFNKFVD